jgi:aryl-alcohol dehydrogenase-like predicted oxidoreductase
MLTRPRPKDPAQGTARAANDDYSPQLYDQPEDWDVVEATRAVAEARGVSMAEVALAWLLARPGVTAPIVGATRLEHLDTAVKALDLKLTPEEIARLEAPYRAHPVRGFH